MEGRCAMPNRDDGTARPPKNGAGRPAWRTSYQASWLCDLIFSLLNSHLRSSRRDCETLNNRTVAAEYSLLPVSRNLPLDRPAFPVVIGRLFGWRAFSSSADSNQPAQ